MFFEKFSTEHISAFSYPSQSGEKCKSDKVHFINESRRETAVEELLLFFEMYEV